MSRTLCTGSERRPVGRTHEHKGATYGFCPECGLTYAVRKDGTMRKHAAPSPVSF